MKNIILFTLWIFAYSILPAQSTIVTYSEDQEEKPQKFVSSYSCFFKTHEEVSRIWKAGYSNFTNRSFPNNTYLSSKNFNIKALDIGIERRIATGLSLGIYLQSRINESIEQLPLYNEEAILSADLFNTSFNVEARWYFQKRKQVQQGLSGNNLSGFYLGLNSILDYWTIDVQKLEFGFVEVQSFNSVGGFTNHNFLSTGWQQQTKNNGYVNFQLGSGFYRQSKDLNTLTIKENGELQLMADNSWNWFLDYQVTIGITRWEESNGQLLKDCSVFEYVEEEKQLWKFDLFNIVDGFSNKGIQGKLSMEYERKIGSSPFSVNPLVQLYYDIPFSEKTPEHQFNFGTELRYYFNLKKLIQKGMTGNGLFASYFATHVYHAPALSPRPRIGMQLGGQHRLFKKLYMDFKGLVDLQTHFEVDGLLDRFGLQYKVGFAF